jgi:hypothetical protein
MTASCAVWTNFSLLVREPSFVDLPLLTLSYMSSMSSLTCFLLLFHSSGILDTRFDEVTSAAAVQSPTNNNASVSYAASDQNISIEEVSTSAAGEEESTTMEHDTNNGDAIVKSTSNSGAGQSQFCVTLCVILILQCSLFL